MTQSKSFPCPSARFSGLITSTQSWLSKEGFKCQKLQTEDGGTLLQIEKVGGWRKLVGMSTALNIVFHQVENTVNVEIGAGRWMDKAATGAVGVFILWPLAVIAGIGTWQQIKDAGACFRACGYVSPLLCVSKPMNCQWLCQNKKTPPKRLRSRGGE
jgi:hypothetical protein